MRHPACSSALPRAALVAALLAACGTGSQDQKDPATEGTAATAGRGSGASEGSTAEGPAGTGAGSAAVPAPLPARGPERAAYSLIDNRLAAHVERGGGLVLPAGSAGFAKYVRFGNGLAGEKPAWLLRQREGDAPVARMTGGKARVHVPLTAEQAARSAVRIRAHAARAGALRVSANGHPAVTGQLDQGWSTLELALPAGQLAAGENTLELAGAAPKLAVAWIHVGAAAPLPEDAELSVHDAGRGALAIPEGGRMSWYVLVPEGARLTARVEAGCTVRVRAAGEGDIRVEGTLAGPAAAVDLAPLAGKAARLELLAAGCPRAVIEAAALSVPGEVPAIRRGEPPAHVVFLILDSLRADRVHAFEPSARAETPVLDKLADSSTLFLRHYVQGNESQVSHASMWTSMYLAKHRAARWQHHIPARLVTLDDIVKRAKLYSAAATGNGYIRPSRGYGVGWNQYVNHIEKQLGLRGDAIMERGLSFVAPRKASPWFLYLGLIDTHVPWIGKPPWIERYSPGYTGRYAKGFRGGAEPGGVSKKLTEREQAHVRAIYDSNVSYQDALLGKLIEQLEAWGVWDRTMLVITADHGDELWEDGRVGHEHGQDDTLLHVPLLVRYPPLFPAARIAHATEGIDVLPTIADALGLDPDDEWQGTSLVPAAHGVHAYAGLASASGYEKEHGARIGAWKLRLAGLADPALFHLATDPDEKQDVFGTPAGAIGGRLVLDAMSLLRAHHATWKKSRWGNPGNVTPRFAADLGE
ncbi:MAG TPA: sulfatase [Kofleriaceae bacterium]|nr:sulfatase [Kofleriaceae bacterium]